MRQEQTDRGLETVLGLRLRQIRRRGGLSLRKVAERIGAEGDSYYSYLARLERGQVRRPSLVLIAEYLRACRARFSDVADVLEEYVARIPKAEIAARQLVAEATEDAPEGLKREVREFDRRRAKAAETRPAGKPKRAMKLLTPAQRVEQARRMIARRFRRVRLEEALYGVISVPEAKGLSAEQLAGLCGLGRRRFQILERTRESQSRRQRQLDREAKRGRRLGLPEAWTQAIVNEVDRLFEEMERSGALDRLPSARDFGPGFRGLKLRPVPGAEKRLKQEQRERVRAQGLQRAAAEAMVIAELDPALHFSRMTGRERHWHLELLRGMFDLALRYDAKPEELEQAVRRLVASSGQPEAARALYERFRAVFPKFRRMAQGR